jgi:phosphoribosylanthranilate isomerase
VCETLASENTAVFRIKICGVRRASDLAHIAAAGADAVGLNFYARSKRYLSPDDAPTVAAAVPPHIARVGVFVNASTAEMQEAAARYRLDFLQLHGDEPANQLAELAPWPVLKAFRFDDDGWSPIEQFLVDCRRDRARLAAVLIDAPSPAGEYGGSGSTVDWRSLADWRSHLDVPLILAGGLTAANVGRAIELVRPAGVDTASGVEGVDGCKDASAVKSFAAAAREALDAV